MPAETARIGQCFLNGTHHGYFLPSEGANNIALALFSFTGMAAYERYRADSFSDAACQAAFDYAEQTHCILAMSEAFFGRFLAEKWNGGGRRFAFPSYRRFAAVVYADRGFCQLSMMTVGVDFNQGCLPLMAAAGVAAAVASTGIWHTTSDASVLRIWSVWLLVGMLSGLGFLCLSRLVGWLLWPKARGFESIGYGSVICLVVAAGLLLLWGWIT